MTDFNEKDLLGTDITKDYSPTAFFVVYPQLRQTPPWTPDMMEFMLRDERVILALAMIVGPIVANIEYEVEGQDATEVTWAKKCIDRFVQNSLHGSLACLGYGHSGGEVLFEENEGIIDFDRVKYMMPRDTTPVTTHSQLVGMIVRSQLTRFGSGPIFVGGPKCYWTVHQRVKHPWYGRAQTYGAFRPWWEKAASGGFLDQRKLWYYKNAFDSGEMYHPEGSGRDASGQLVSYKAMARELIDKKRSGATLIFPHIVDDKGNRKWEYKPPIAIDVPSGLHDYGYDLNDEIFQGMEIPPELVESSGEEGLGSASGREIPMKAFENILTQIGNDRLQDFTTQVIIPVGKLNFKGTMKIIVNVKKIEVSSSTDPLLGPDGQPMLDEDGNPLPPENGEGGDDSGKPPFGKGASGAGGKGKPVPPKGKGKPVPAKPKPKPKAKAKVV